VISQNDLTAIGRETSGARQADAMGRAGHDDNAVLSHDPDSR
jgi:hypothetical protein